jgi:hypothetical protein
MLFSRNMNKVKIEELNVKKPPGHQGIRQFGSMEHFKKELSVNLDPKIDSPYAVSKFLQCLKNTIEFSLGLQISRFSLAVHEPKRVGCFSVFCI